MHPSLIRQQWYAAHVPPVDPNQQAATAHELQDEPRREVRRQLADAIRTILAAASRKHEKRYILEILEP